MNRRVKRAWPSPPRPQAVTTVAYSGGRNYAISVAKLRHWVFLAYRLPREPSTPRISVWRKLKALGVVQLLDGLAALPLTPKSREQLEWLADEVLEAEGESSIWIAQAATMAQERDLVDAMDEAIAQEYQSLAVEAGDAETSEPDARRRALRRFRRQMYRISQRDYFAPPEKEAAVEAIKRLAEVAEVRS